MSAIEIIKFNGAPDLLAWKYPSQELGTWTQLIVNESQEALLFKSGKATDVFGSGRHTLSTNNIPLLNEMINLPYEGRSPFTAEVWFINKLHVLDIKWGTFSPIQIQDPKYGILTPVRSFGQFGIQISNSKKFLIKLLGTTRNFDKESLVKYFRGLFVSKAKDSISSFLVHKRISIVEINAYLDELSEYIKERVKPIMADYGIELLNFYVNDVNMPEDDKAVNQLKDALAKRAEMDIVGFDYRSERSFDTLEGAANNQGSSSNILGTGMGMGMGFGIGGAMGGQFRDMGKSFTTRPVAMARCSKCDLSMPPHSEFCPHCGHDNAENLQRNKITCVKCGANIPRGAKFCPECGNIYNACPRCGNDLPDGATMCKQCGFALPTLCPSCGATIKADNAKFCPSCGTTLKETCSSCDAELSSAAKFCPNCGKKVDHKGDRN